MTLKCGWQLLSRMAMVGGSVLAGLIFASCEQRLPSRAEIRAGGDTTVTIRTSQAFATPAPNLTGDRLARHLKGDAEFEAKFVTPPAEINAGLGPHFNNVSCINCHLGDGRGRPDHVDGSLSSLFLRVSLPGEGPYGGPKPVPGFGLQLADRATYGVVAEGKMEVEYREIPVT